MKKILALSFFAGILPMSLLAQTSEKSMIVYGFVEEVATPNESYSSDAVVYSEGNGLKINIKGDNAIIEGLYDELIYAKILTVGNDQIVLQFSSIKPIRFEMMSGSVKIGRVEFVTIGVKPLRVELSV